MTYINCTSGIGISMFRLDQSWYKILLVIISSKHLIMHNGTGHMLQP
jgi:hypothetical protein